MMHGQENIKLSVLLLVRAIHPLAQTHCHSSIQSNSWSVRHSVSQAVSRSVSL